MQYDFIIIGAGIVGVSTAWQLQQKLPDKKILVLEKESGYARHQTGHNSGVIHAGVYYQPGSLKARFCKQGLRDTVAFCREENIPFEQCGKLLVATNGLEYRRMEALLQRCRENEIEAEWLTRAQLHEREPNIAGVGAILIPSTGIVNFTRVTEKMAERFIRLGGEVKLNTQVTGLKETGEAVHVITDKGKFSAKYLVTCSGLMSDRTVKMLGLKTDFRIIPFRGEYFQLPKEKSNIVRHLIYPIPDPDLPFLGVHLTRMIDGSVTVGPNAVLGLKREGYRRFNVSVKDCWQMFAYKGFWRMVRNQWKFAVHEMKNSLYRAGYLKEVRKYCPQVTLQDLQPYPAGIRAQAVRRDGSLVHDFLFAESPRSLHVCNAPSPAATSAMPIGNYICDKILEKTAQP